MGRIHLQTFIQAPIDRCFDLSRSVDVHVVSTSGTQERAIAGVTSGLMNLGDVVTWEAVHFGFRQTLTVKITEMIRPHTFTDVQVTGIFRNFTHTHYFKSKEGGALMIDDLHFVCPFGFAGRLIADRIVTRHLTQFLKTRNQQLKKIAEGDSWREILEF